MEAEKSGYRIFRRRVGWGLMGLVGALLLSIWLAGSAAAGGWAAVTLDEIPTDVVAGEPLTIGFVVRRHGIMRQSDLPVTIQARHTESGATVETAGHSVSGEVGHYTATLTFPEAGRWQWEILAINRPQPMPALAVSDPGALVAAPAPARSIPWGAGGVSMVGLLGAVLLGVRRRPGLGLLVGALAVVVGAGALTMGGVQNGATAASPAELSGEALFLAKGCISCHAHEGVDTGDIADASFEFARSLTTYRGDPEFLRAWLKNPPAVRPGTGMPNLELKEAEIEALVAFLSDGAASSGGADAVATPAAAVAPPSTASADDVPLAPWAPVTLPKAKQPVPGVAGTVQTRLYLTAFDMPVVSQIDPGSGAVLHEVPVEGQVPGVAVSPDGTRLYVVDGAEGGWLHVWDTKTWKQFADAPVKDRAMWLGGNPLSLSGDGRWLVVEHFNYETNQAWSSLFDTETLTFTEPGRFPRHLDACERPRPLVGQQGHPRSYTVCQGSLLALGHDAEQPLAELWRAPLPTGARVELVLAPDGRWLYGLAVRPSNPVTGSEADLRLMVWEPETGRLYREATLNEAMEVPPATVGRGDRGGIVVTGFGQHVMLLWEDRLWTIDAETLMPLGESRLPAPADGMVLSMDGHELYVIPAMAGDLTTRGRGLWTVEVGMQRLVRQAEGWPPRLMVLALLAARG